MSMENCFVCEKPHQELYECESCNNSICYDCCVPYNQFTQIDYTLCRACYGKQQDDYADDCVIEEKIEKEKQKEKEIKNSKQRAYYHSPKAVEKRRLKKIKEQERKEALRKESALRMASILAEIFKDLK